VFLLPAGGAAFAGVVDEGGVVDLGLQIGAVSGVEDLQVVDAGGLGLLTPIFAARN